MYVRYHFWFLSLAIAYFAVVIVFGFWLSYNPFFLGRPKSVMLLHILVCPCFLHILSQRHKNQGKNQPLKGAKAARVNSSTEH